MSKEEIEKAKRVINKEKKDFQNELNIELDPIIKDEDRDELRIAYLVSRIEAIETLFQYIDQLEQENKALKKGITSLMASRKKWRYRYYNLKAKNKEDIEGWENVLDCAKFEINKREQENNKQSKIIDEMAKYIKEPYQLYIFKGRMSKITAIKQYFEKKVEER